MPRGRTSRRITRRRNANHKSNKEMTMSTATDYTKLAAKLDYAALEKKLEQLTQRDPPRKRKTVADVLEPLRERLLDLHSKGWSARPTGRRVENCRRDGESGAVARVLERLDGWRRSEPRDRARAADRNAPRQTAQPTITAGHSGRGNESQTGQRVTTR